MPQHAINSQNSTNAKPALSRLSLRILVYIILVSTIFAILSTLVQLRFDYQQDLSVIEETAIKIESSLAQPMAASLWNLDEQQLEIQVEGLLSLATVQSVQVRELIDGNGVPILLRGDINAPQQTKKSFELIYQGQPVGELIIGSSLHSVIERIKSKAWISLLTQIIQTLCLSIAILLIIYFSLIRHLNRIVEHTRSLDLDKSAPGLKLQRPAFSSRKDELDSLVETLDQMHQRIHSELRANQATNIALQAERDFVKTVIDSSNAVIITLDKKFKIKDVNPSGVLLTGFTQDEMRGQNWISLFVDHEQRNIIEPLLASGKNLQDIELNLTDLQGRQQTLLWSFALVYEHERVKSIVAFGHEITSIRSSQQQVLELNEQLEAKVSQRTQRLEERNRLLASTLEELKDTQESLIAAEKQASFNQLFQIFSRELNLPIASALSDAQDLRLRCEKISEQVTITDAAETLDQQQQQHLHLESQLERLAHVTSNFKQLVVDDEQRIAYAFSINDNIQQLLHSMHDRLENQHVSCHIKCDPQLEIHSYPAAFSQIFSNLISNSLVHGFDQWSGERRIDIQISTYRSHLRVIYQDSGKGIEPTMAATLFSASPSSAQASANGLGCHIIASLVRQLLGGEISIDLSEGPGSRIKIVLPLEENKKNLI
ncbi:PAS domain S-box protein [Alginatibacterium sediminis]|uniref:PAS domain S-box protein n=1 Tax=Alginatibacterium sediminis TaxID=2164068 RepID=A0A420E5P9_9ALTE|nr:ATP-binding protein [Alginatibacterium sediminis]RKF13179.1 PAS domain S-box protein [Alginatibacterium sediminis]